MPNPYLESKPYLKFAIAAAVFWTVGAVLSVGWNLRSQQLSIEAAARTAARTAYEKDVVYRSWSARHGGVYVPVSDYAVPNPYLEGIPDREIKTTDGRVLTLMNPAYMNRQVHAIERTRTGVQGHLTSLKPIRPGNAPDDWEREALLNIVDGREEQSSIETMDGREYMRLMRPVITEEACLKCHERGGYAVGEVRGGLSIAIPMEPFYLAARGSVRAIWLWHAFTWLLGITGIGFAANRLNDYYRRQGAAEKRVRDSLREKEVLLREIHHRVKNNLQVISGILELQAAAVGDPETGFTLRESRNRVAAMAHLHHRLYQSEDLTHISMDDYIRGLTEDIFTSLGMDGSRVSLEVAAEPIALDLDTAIPFGLMVNELVTNCVKYAFPDGQYPGDARITVGFRPGEGQRFILTVSDNGVGLAEGYDLKRSTSLGLKLVHSLVEQMGGTIRLEEGPGVTWVVDCPLDFGAEGAVDSENRNQVPDSARDREPEDRSQEKNR